MLTRMMAACPSLNLPCAVHGLSLTELLDQRRLGPSRYPWALGKTRLRQRPQPMASPLRSPGPAWACLAPAEAALGSVGRSHPVGVLWSRVGCSRRRASQLMREEDSALRLCATLSPSVVLDLGEVGGEYQFRGKGNQVWPFPCPLWAHPYWGSTVCKCLV